MEETYLHIGTNMKLKKIKQAIQIYKKGGLRVISKEVLKEITRWKKRPVIEINTIIGCSNLCVYCPQSTLIKSYKTKLNHEKKDFANNRILSFQTFKDCLEKVPRKVEIVFSGMAEPFLNPECTKMILHAHKKGHKISVYTTLVGLNIKNIKQIEKVPFTEFIVHLADNDPNNTKIPHDIAHRKKLVSLVKDFKIKNISFMCIGEIHPEIEEVLPNKYIRQDPIISRGDNVERDKLLAISDYKSEKYTKSSFRRKGKLKCFKLINGGQQVTLFPTGDVGLCCMDYGMMHILGNLLKINYLDLFRSAEWKKVLKGLEDETINILCRTCEWAEPK